MNKARKQWLAEVVAGMIMGLLVMAFVWLFCGGILQYILKLSSAPFDVTEVPIMLGLFRMCCGVALGLGWYVSVRKPPKLKGLLK